MGSTPLLLNYIDKRFEKIPIFCSHEFLTDLKKLPDGNNFKQLVDYMKSLKYHVEDAVLFAHSVSEASNHVVPVSFATNFSAGPAVYIPGATISDICESAIGERSKDLNAVHGIEFKIFSNYLGKMPMPFAFCYNKD